MVNTFHWSDWTTVKICFIFPVFTPWLFPAEIDHCADGKHGCEQESMNTEHSCVCKCRKGFTLRPDGKSCQSESKLIWCGYDVNIHKHWIVGYYRIELPRNKQHTIKACHFCSRHVTSSVASGSELRFLMHFILSASTRAKLQMRDDLNIILITYLAV